MAQDTEIRPILFLTPEMSPGTPLSSVTRFRSYSQPVIGMIGSAFDAFNGLRCFVEPPPYVCFDYEYREAGYPYGKSIKGLKKWRKKTSQT